MIKFFRKIRQKLLEQNRVSKYLLYALGEIILVVIAILIALQINNWNEQRNELKDESIILNNLHDEFAQNLEILKNQKVEVEHAHTTGVKLMSFFDKDNTFFNNQNIDNLLYVVLESGSFRPSENTIDDLLQSGRLKLLKNEKLKNYLYQWKSNLQAVQTSFSRIEIKIDNDLVPYLTKNYSIKDIDQYGFLNWKTKSTLSVDKNAIFKDIIFENILDDYLYRIITTKLRLNEVEILIQQILKQTKQN